MLIAELSVMALCLGVYVAIEQPEVLLGAASAALAALLNTINRLWRRRSDEEDVDLD